MTFVGALETGLKFNDFHGYPGAPPDPAPRPGRGDLRVGWVPNKRASIFIQS